MCVCVCVHTHKHARPHPLLWCTVYLQKQTNIKSPDILQQTKCLQSAPRGARENRPPLQLDLPASWSRSLSFDIVRTVLLPLAGSPLAATGPKLDCSQSNDRQQQQTERAREGRGFLRAPREDSRTRKVTKEKKGERALTGGQQEGGWCGESASC